MWEKLKSIIEDDNVFVAFLFVLVGFGSFGLGRMSVQDMPGQASIPAAFQPRMMGSQINATSSTSLNTSKTDKSIKAEPEFGPQSTSGGQNVQNFVASKSGTKYHRLTCPGAKQIKESNKIFFATVDEAESAGYSKATNCPDL